VLQVTLRVRVVSRFDRWHCRIVLQCVAVCCSVLQCVAVCCGELQCVEVCCSCLYVCGQSVASTANTHISVLPCVAVFRSALQCVAIDFARAGSQSRRPLTLPHRVHCVVVCCGVVQRVAVSRCILQC